MVALFLLLLFLLTYTTLLALISLVGPVPPLLEVVDAGVDKKDEQNDKYMLNADIVNYKLNQLPNNDQLNQFEHPESSPLKDITPSVGSRSQNTKTPFLRFPIIILIVTLVIPLILMLIIDQISQIHQTPQITFQILPCYLLSLHQLCMQFVIFGMQKGLKW